MQWSLHFHNQQATGGYTGNRASPTAIGAAVAVHVAIAAIILSMPGIKIIEMPKLPIRGYNIPLDVDPPPVKPSPPPKEKLQPVKNEAVPPVAPDISPSQPDRGIIFDTSNQWTNIDSGNGGSPQERTPPLPQPIIIDAQPDRRYLSDFQPDYPGAMVRAGIEGFAKVKATIAADGHVQSLELIEATDPSFWEATRKQALKRWRFKPATRDGRPIVSEKIMTVRFRLSDLR